jgi:hypothetical protein
VGEGGDTARAANRCLRVRGFGIPKISEMENTVKRWQGWFDELLILDISTLNSSLTEVPGQSLNKSPPPESA